MRQACWIALLAVPAAAASAAPDCAALQARALRESVGLHPPQTVRIDGVGRAGFHAGPDPGCRQPGLFVVPGDRVTALVPWHGWMQVRFVARDGRRYLAWLEAARVPLAAP